MKHFKSPIVMAFVFACFACFLLGTFLGRNLHRETIVIETSETTALTQPTATEPERTLPVADRLNINSASVLELAQLPGIGQTIAQRIVDYREANGSFRSVEELTDVEGIGAKRMDELRDLVTVQ